MTSTSTATHHNINRPNMVAVGTIVWLSSELMFFAALFAMYFTTRAVQGPEIWLESTEVLNIPFAAFNTTVLVLSSVTCQFGVFAAERFQAKRTGSLLNVKSWGMREWFSLTFLMGAFFIAGQVYEYASLTHEGLALSTNAYTSVFYLATGFHGLHVTGGLIAFLIVMVRVAKARRFTHNQATTAIVASYYWHFVDVVWIALFAAIYLIK
ncbi:cytochrome c oxidase subunit III [Candidatus Planktophila lacus]|jgi:cytochrome c oxidase subunit 3|uniref:aa3-type cytochrome oxidase subunit III n=1 Tax=Candidatus Planktophila lacus TaxID=1884913 RepID=UPI000BAC7B8E|nr:heme-copper oxidase subunit III [Candidatus Planktophila lacus]ASY25143.1 cytochrome c oxidase subunit III [Candidatus Planktophila lacus]ASY29104.1 cytochrome c oxidase subunit III [Candidatus Planktophila lacus]